MVLIRKPPDIPALEITSEQNYLDRRRFLRDGTLVAAASLAPPAFGASVPAVEGAALENVVASKFSTREDPNSLEDITTYNNYYEFGTGKGDPARHAQDFQPRPWSIEVSGNAETTGIFDFEDLIRPQQLEERIYRLRCVEAWSMVVPWVGIPLADVIRRLRPLSGAKYVAFETLYDPDRMPGQRSRVLDWPYREGLTIAEAMNPLTILAVGLYGKVLPNQNGAPIRLVVPWKYGFKSIKGIVSMRFVEQQPRTSWEMAAPDEYGFYANVNPEVDHPRWSQARERRIGAGLFASKKPTLPFNGYGEQVAHLYADLDLRRNF
ncbi:MAG: protein-methionine-sulfoxide reductase catalytic subunit MsrP [Woeseia sp.]